MVMISGDQGDSLKCTIRMLDGQFVEDEPEVGRWYISVDNRKGAHILGATARYLGEGDFLSTTDDYFDDACGVMPGVYLLLLRHQTLTD